MDHFNEAEDLPLGLMMQLGQDLEAMSTFASLSDSDKENMVNFIKAAATGDDAKSRINQVMDALEHHQTMF